MKKRNNALQNPPRLAGLFHDNEEMSVGVDWAVCVCLGEERMGEILKD